ncbi:hypothetical protein [Streptomyces sp. NPDC012825]|uniref:hypothetical protein n=1 Tax=Streptomyces sp. NPDC012825 TaxID=3364851 RepID=UPI00368F29E5
MLELSELRFRGGGHQAQAGGCAARGGGEKAGGDAVGVQVLEDGVRRVGMLEEAV